MMRICVAVLVLASAAGSIRAEDSAVKLTEEKGTIKVELQGKHFTTYYFNDGNKQVFIRPFFYPVLAGDDTEITTDQANVAGGDHFHHRSMWVAHGDVNGADHWAMTLKEKQPKQRHIKFTKMENNGFEEELEWESKENTPMLKETRTVRFFAYPDGARGVDFTILLNPIAGPVTFGDTKEAGLCSLRVVKALSLTGEITNAAGQKGEKEAWGKPAKWCDISGKIDGKPYGAAILDHPTNPRHPTSWHVRQYGLMSANIWGLSAFNKELAKGAGAWTIEKDKPAMFRYRVVIHQGDAAAAKLNEKFSEFEGVK